MFGFNFGEMLLLAAIALIAIGPKQLPEVARTVGRLLNEFRKATGDFQKTLSDMDAHTGGAFNDVKKSITDSLAPAANSIARIQAPVEGPTMYTPPAEDPNQQSFNMDQHNSSHGYPGDVEAMQKALDEANQLSFNLDEIAAPGDKKHES